MDLFRDKTSDLKNQTLSVAIFQHIPAVAKIVMPETKSVRTILPTGANDSMGFSGIEVEVISSRISIVIYLCLKKLSSTGAGNSNAGYELQSRLVRTANSYCGALGPETARWTVFRSTWRNSQKSRWTSFGWPALHPFSSRYHGPISTVQHRMPNFPHSRITNQQFLENSHSTFHVSSLAAYGQTWSNSTSYLLDHGCGQP